MADVLIVVDDLDVGGTLAELLAELGHARRIAHDGQEGLLMLEQRQAGLLLLDVEMLVLDGPGMVLRLLMYDAGLERVPIVLLSGMANLWQVAPRIGTPYFLAKPNGSTELEVVAARALVERRPPRR